MMATASESLRINGKRRDSRGVVSPLLHFASTAALALKSSTRNVLRNRRRTAASSLAIIFGCIAIMVSVGFIDWIFQAMRAVAVKTGLGNAQIAAPGFWTKGSTDPAGFLIPGEPKGIASLRVDPRVVAVAPRLQFNGLAVAGESSVPFLALGVDPAAENYINETLKNVKGQPLRGDDASEALLGTGLAAALKVKAGDKIALLVTTPSGGFNATDVVVAGTFSAEVKAIDDTILRVPIGLARTLTRSSGTHEWAVALRETEMTDAFVSDARAALAGSGLEVKPWYTMADFYNKTHALLTSQMNFVVVIIAAIVAMVISNLMIMSVLERTREIGTMLALGTSRRQVLAGFLLEGLLLGVVAATVGIALGALLSLLISHIGIPMPAPPGRDKGYLGEILLTWRGAALAFAAGAGAATLAGIYPAWKASRLPIVDSLRHNV